MIDAVDLARALPHQRAPRPLHFPSEAEVSETLLHLLMRTMLFQILKRTVGSRGAVGSEQFIYYNASNPQQCLSPDAFVKLGASSTEAFPIWKVWERGAPELAIEVWSDSDHEEWEKKLGRFHELGVRELVCFDMDAPAGERLRVWDRLDDDLVQRAVTNDSTPCATLGMHWVVRPADEIPVALRLAHDVAGKQVVSSPEEARVAAEQARVAAEQARAAAERRIAELEAELKKRGG
jgi:Uma2 family endonuclease